MILVDEFCPYCEEEVSFYAEYQTYATCPVCQRAILPCSLCDMDKVNCNDCFSVLINKEDTDE